MRALIGFASCQNRRAHPGHLAPTRLPLGSRRSVSYSQHLKRPDRTATVLKGRSQSSDSLGPRNFASADFRPHYLPAFLLTGGPRNQGRRTRKCTPVTAALPTGFDSCQDPTQLPPKPIRVRGQRRCPLRLQQAGRIATARMVTGTPASKPIQEERSGGSRPRSATCLGPATTALGLGARQVNRYWPVGRRASAMCPPAGLSGCRSLCP